MENKISILVCSINEQLRNNLLQNVEATIGYDFEFLYEDNRANNDGLCKVYNRLAKRATGDFLCFVHEDVILKTQNWGDLLIKFAENPQIGVIGFAGAPAVTGYVWWDLSFAYTTPNKSIAKKLQQQETDLFWIILIVLRYKITHLTGLYKLKQ
jgi:glycosyltransferase involved in cell wall biosynthesis